MPYSCLADDSEILEPHEVEKCDSYTRRECKIVPGGETVCEEDRRLCQPEVVEEECKTVPKFQPEDPMQLIKARFCITVKETRYTVHK